MHTNTVFPLQKHKTQNTKNQANFKIVRTPLYVRTCN